MKKAPPQAHGGKREGSGRPTNWVRDKCAAIIDKHKLFDQLAKIAAGAPKHTDRLRAMEILFDRAYGKTIQDVQMGGSVAVNYTIKVQSA